MDEDEQDPGPVEPEEVVVWVHGDFPRIHGGLLRGHLVRHLGYDVLQLRPNQEQQLNAEQSKAGHTTIKHKGKRQKYTFRSSTYSQRDQ